MLEVMHVPLGGNAVAHLVEQSTFRLIEVTANNNALGGSMLFSFSEYFSEQFHTCTLPKACRGHTEVIDPACWFTRIVHRGSLYKVGDDKTINRARALMHQYDYILAREQALQEESMLFLRIFGFTPKERLLVLVL